MAVAGVTAVTALRVMRYLHTLTHTHTAGRYRENCDQPAHRQRLPFCQPKQHLITHITCVRTWLKHVMTLPQRGITPILPQNGHIPGDIPIRRIPFQRLEPGSRSACVARHERLTRYGWLGIPPNSDAAFHCSTGGRVQRPAFSRLAPQHLSFTSALLQNTVVVNSCRSCVRLDVR